MKTVIFVKMEEVGKLTAELEKYYALGGERGVQEHLKSIGFEPGRFYQELEMTSRYVDTHQDYSMSNSQVSLHSHIFYEILCCQSTCDVEYLAGAERYRLRKGDIVVIPPGVSHRPLLPEHLTEAYRRDVLWISAEFMDMIMRMFPDETSGKRDHSIPIRTAGTRWEFLGDVFRAGVLEEEEKRPGWEAAVVGNTLTIFANMKRNRRRRNRRNRVGKRQ